MIRILVRTLVYFGSAAIGILVASLVLDDVEVQASGFVTVVVVYAIVQSILTPFTAKFAAKNASAFLGGTGLLAAFLALLVASMLGGDALSISGVGTWVAATVVIWLVTALATLVLPFFLVRVGLDAARARKENSR